MIKFNCLIHKETGTVIKYEDWLDKFQKEGLFKILGENDSGFWVYHPKKMLFNNDFEIIYESEFTYRELRNIFLGMNDKKLCYKAKNKMDSMEKYDSQTVEKELDEIYKNKYNRGVKNDL